VTSGSTETTNAPTEGTVVGDLLAIARFHIVLIAIVACLTFGWLMTGRYALALAPVVAVDWFLINLLNRITDIEEDLRNGIPGTARVARRKPFFGALVGVLFVGSFVTTHWLWPALTPFRLVVQAIGCGYSYRLVPTPRGFRRFKEIYFLKNFMSAVLFVLTCFVYPLVVYRTDTGATPQMAVPGIVTLVAFFDTIEITYEILYDLRDLPGDQAEGVPTYPVVHGELASRRIIDALLIVATVILLIGLGARFLGLREGLMLAAPAVQFFFYRPRFRRGLTTPDCIWLTHLGSAELLLYLVGNRLWLAAGLPANLYL
jgi:4-hydroxybenzoate polyprenyltransferase